MGVLQGLVMASWTDVHVTTVYFKHVLFIICPLYFHKGNFQRADMGKMKENKDCFDKQKPRIHNQHIYTTRDVKGSSSD